MTKNNSKTWKDIEEEFKGYVNSKLITRLPDCDVEEMIAFFKPYFQELLHKEAKEELETVDNH